MKIKNNEKDKKMLLDFFKFLFVEKNWFITNDNKMIENRYIVLYP